MPRILSNTATSTNVGPAEEAPGRRLLSMATVVARTTYSRPSIYRLIAQGLFPAPLKLGSTKIAFREDEISQWLNSRPRALQQSEKS
jgi:prophage regulatory protein